MTEFKRIPPEQAQALREQGAVLVDVRDAQSFQSNHIPESLHWTTSRSATSSVKPTSTSHWSWSVTTATPARALRPTRGSGFSDVYSVDGGFELWRATYPDKTAQG